MNGGRIDPVDPIDRDVLGRLDFGDPPGHVLGMLLDTFLAHSPAVAEQLGAAGAAGDAAATAAAAHALKSSVRQYGAMALGDQLEAIERAAASGRVDESAVRAALDGYADVRAALADARARLLR